MLQICLVLIDVQYDIEKYQAITLFNNKSAVSFRPMTVQHKFQAAAVAWSSSFAICFRRDYVAIDTHLMFAKLQDTLNIVLPRIPP